MLDIQAEKFSFAAYVADLLTTKEVRESVDSVISEVIDQWGNESFSRKITSTPAKWAIKKSLSTPVDTPDKEALSDLLNKPENIEKTALLFPILIEGLTDFLHAMTVHFETLEDEKKRTIIDGFFSSFNPEKTGKIITGFARSFESLYQTHPDLVSQRALPAFEAFLKNTDLSSIKDLFETSQQDIATVLTGVTGLLFSYPGKLVTTLSFLPGLITIATVFTEDLFKRFNSLPPDILTDILMSFFKEVDEKPIGKLINNVNEFIRQTHTGSALIGEPGAPRFTTELLKKMRGVISDIDPELLLKSGIAFGDGKETLIKSFQTILSENPDMLLQHLGQFTSGRNSAIRLLKHKLELIEALDEEDAAKALATGLASWNAYDTAEVINSLAVIANNLHEVSPGVMEKLVHEFTNTLDLNELATAVKQISNETSGALKPLIRTVLPILTQGVIESLKPDSDGNNASIEEARGMLRQFIMGSEVN